MGLFFYTQKGSIISTVDLPTTEIIEPKKIVNLGAERTEYRMVWGRISQLFQPRFDGFC